MTRPLLFLWILISFAATAVGLFVHATYQRNVSESEVQTRALLEQRLLPYRERIENLLDAYHLELDRLLLPAVIDLQTIVSIKRSPYVQQVISIDSENRIIYPTNLEGFPDRDLNLMRDALEVLRGIGASFDTSESPSSVTNGNAEDSEKRSRSWVTWFHGRGLVLSFFHEDSQGNRTFLIVPRGKWMSDLIAALPEESSTPNTKTLRGPAAAFRVIDAANDVVYQWGATVDAPEFESPGQARMSLPDPLEYWSLQAVLVDGQTEYSRSTSPWFYFLAAVSTILLLLLIGAFISYWMQSAMSLAARRVSFVNQVSHELKTPLTNVKLYCDLLGQDLEGLEDEKDSHRFTARLATIQSEADRLQFLIDNILQFARNTRKQRELQLRMIVPDQVVIAVSERMRERLRLAGVQSEVDLHAGRSVMIDPNVVDLILSNLLSNVEKYAAEGKRVIIQTKIHNKFFNLVVQDYGRGIPLGKRQIVFQPFERLDSSLEAVAGTGIGLSIVRDLCVLHGGTCEIEDSAQGARFVVNLMLGSGVNV